MSLELNEVDQAIEVAFKEASAVEIFARRLEERIGKRWYWGMTNPSANQSRPPRPGAYRYCACVSWAWPVLRATEVAHTNTAVPVLPEAIPDKESPAAEWVLQPALGVLSPPTTTAMPFARPS